MLESEGIKSQSHSLRAYLGSKCVAHRNYLGDIISCCKVEI